MLKSSTKILLLFLVFNASATVVRFETTVGVIDIELYSEQAPVTVENFLNYVSRGDYDESTVHRSVPGFVVQGGGFTYLGNRRFEPIPNDGPIINEAQLSNLEGTVAMARASNPNSATNQWFINLKNNSSLDPTNSNAGYAVFGKVIRGMDVVRVIESLARVNFNDATPSGVFGELPVYRYISGAIDVDNIVEINRAYVLSDAFQINAGLSGAWYNQSTSGQGFYLEVLPTLNSMLVAWFTYDTVTPADEVEADLGSAGHRWMTIEGTFDENNVYQGVLVLTQGGLFDDNEPVNSTAYGTVTIEFTDCGHATMTYEIPDLGISSTIPLTRQSGANVALCEQLAIETNAGVTE